MKGHRGKVARALAEAGAHHQAGRLDAAEARYRKILKARPGLPEALNGLGLLCLQTQKNDAAAGFLTELVALRPNLSSAHNYLAMACKRLGRLADAVVHYQQAVALDGSLAGAYSDMGTCLEQLGRLDEAESAYRSALELNPALLAGHGNLAAVLQLLGRPDEALVHLQQAVKLDPKNGLWHYRMGVIRGDQGEDKMAIAACDEAVRLTPNLVEAHFKLGRLLYGQNMVEAAAESFSRCVALAPNLTDARALLTHCWRRVGNWTALADQVRCLSDDLENRPGIAINPMVMLGGEFSAQRQHQNNVDYVQQAYAHPTHLEPLPRFTFRREPVDKLTIGYLSGDYRQHVVASLVVGLLEAHDRSRFNIYGYATGPADDSELGLRVYGAVDHLVDLQRLDGAAAAQRIYDDGVDILVDLTGHTAHSRVDVLLRRPAPIQVNYLGFSATSGIPTLDYIVADGFVAPPASQPHFSERIVQLPDCYMVTDPHREVFDGPLNRAAYGLPDDGVVLACFNDTYKITPAIYDVWMRILNAVPGSVLWLRFTNQTTQNNLRREAAARGIDVARILFFTRVDSHAEHMARQTLADLFLDTMPYNAHASTADALYVGVPVVTCPGETFASRVAGSLLHNVGMDELICADIAAYEALAIDLAQDPTRLADMRARLKAGCANGPLFNTERFTRHMETAYRMMWQRHLDGDDPAPLVVP